MSGLDVQQIHLCLFNKSSNLAADQSMIKYELIFFPNNKNDFQRGEKG
jgi:hypothetical protein